MRAIIFDLDGTITQLELPLELMRSDAKQYYISKGLPANLLESADGISSSTAKAKDYFLSNGVSLQDWDILQEELDKLMSQHETSSAQSVNLMDRALETVSEVRSLGIKTAVLTNNSRDAMDIILRQVPLEQYFEIIQTRHESPSPKPYPDGLIHLAQLLSVDVSEAVYVGDAVIDGVAAARAGMEFWGVTTGETNCQKLLSVGASVVVSSIYDIKDLVLERIKNIRYA